MHKAEANKATFTSLPGMLAVEVPLCITYLLQHLSWWRRPIRRLMFLGA